MFDRVLNVSVLHITFSSAISLSRVAISTASCNSTRSLFSLIFSAASRASWSKINLLVLVSCVSPFHVYCWKMVKYTLKSLALFATQDFKSMFGHFSTIRRKGLIFWFRKRKHDYWTPEFFSQYLESMCNALLQFCFHKISLIFNSEIFFNVTLL